MSDLPDIPFFDLGGAGPLALIEQAPGYAHGMISCGRQQYSPMAVDVMDRLSRRWAHKATSPYLAELQAAGEADLPGGIWFMNHAYEWGCTTCASQDESSGGVSLRRSLDWPFDGLGRHVVVARQDSPAGPYVNITWPGFLGVITAMAPGRFAIAINQAPVLRRASFLPRWCWPVDWVISRWTTWQSDFRAPGFLLRQVFESCETYADAKKMLSETPIALPVFYTIAGTEPDQACVIERLAERARVFEDPAAVANHWLSPDLEGRSRGQESETRRQRICAAAQDPDAALLTGGFSWLTPPVLNKDTRLAVEANARTGRLVVQGYEKTGAATTVFSLP
ncbi:MAG: carcinine hydrolase/isopenicillin-N N-acyltransferase family protein [Pseudomonadota bacterium]